MRSSLSVTVATVAYGKQQVSKGDELHAIVVFQKLDCNDLVLKSLIVRSRSCRPLQVSGIWVS